MQKLRLSDYSKIKPFLDAANYEGYNSNFVTMMMWDHEYHVQYEIHDHFMVMLQEYKNKFFFAMPFCEEKYRKEAIDYMMAYAQEKNIDFVMDGVTADVKEYIQNIYGLKFMYQRTPNNDDYVYDKSMLSSLTGKKMQKRRNHFNAFIKNYPDFVYKEIEDEDIDQVLLCLRRWDLEHVKEESVQSEFMGIMYLLMHRDELSIKTGCIYINGTLEAFTIGSELKHQTIEIHVEKANKEIRGLYVAICKYFLENNYKDYVYVNREEDMGIPSLRKAKRALHPISMVHKYQICYRNTNVTKAKSEDLDRIRQLWTICFPDEDEASTNFYFQQCYKPEHTFVLSQDKTILSAMQIVPYTIENKEQVYFILGVCTNPVYQKNGCMKEMIQEVLSIEPYASHRIFLQAYVPAIYYPFGFKETYYHQHSKIDSSKYPFTSTLTTREISAKSQLELYENYCKNFSGYRLRNLEYYEKYLRLRCAAFEETLTGVYDANRILGYVIYKESDCAITISEVIYTSQESLNKIISYFSNKNKSVTIVTDMKASILGETNITCTMLTNDNKTKEIDTNLFINELY